MARHADRFSANHRMAVPLRTLDRFHPQRSAAMRADAADFLRRMDAGEIV